MTTNNFSGAIHSLLVSPDDLKVVTTSIDKMIKFFEILSFDMSHMISTEYVPTAAVWLSSDRGLFSRVGIADMNSGSIRIYRADGGQLQGLAEITVHSQPVKLVSRGILRTVYCILYTLNSVCLSIAFNWAL